jgi:hypothetical protein
MPPGGFRLAGAQHGWPVTAGHLGSPRQPFRKFLCLAHLKIFPYALASVLSQAQRAELADCGHLAPGNSGKPECIARELLSFLTS